MPVVIKVKQHGVQIKLLQNYQWITNIAKPKYLKIYYPIKS